MSVPDPNPSTSNPLQRAHALSLQASQLLRPAQPTLTSLNTALCQYREAADLFESASTAVAASNSQGGDERKTLNMLVTQHRKLARDVERRISTSPLAATGSSRMGVISGERSASSTAAGEVHVSAAHRRGPDTLSMRSASLNSPPTESRLGIPRSSPIGVGTGGSSTFANGLSLSPPQGIPPFALRPPSSLVGNAPPSFLPHRLGPGSPPISTRSGVVPGTIQNAGATPGGGGGGGSTGSFSPLYSSSSSSSAPEESYIHFGPRPDDHSSNLDPFSRFWGMLENMIEEVSNPVVFASAPMNLPDPTPMPAARSSEDATTRAALKEKRTRSKKDRDKDRETMGDDGKGMSDESFYMVRKGKQRESESNPKDDEEEGEEISRPTSPTAPSKTSEELLLENTSLKSSLDAIALHAQSLERSNKDLTTQLEGRERGLKVAMEGIKREALKGQEMFRSQLLAGSVVGTSTRVGSGTERGPVAGTPAGAISGGAGAGAGGEKDGQKEDYSKRRIRELEDEVRALKGENEKQKSQIDKYKDRFEKIKINAKAKKEAKAKLASSTTTTGTGAASRAAGGTGTSGGKDDLSGIDLGSGTI